MKDKQQGLKKKIRKQQPKMEFSDDQLSSPLITNEILLSKHSSVLSSPESVKQVPGSMLEFLLNIEDFPHSLSL